MTADPFERHTPGALLSVCTDDPPSPAVCKVLADLAEAARAVVGPDVYFGFAFADVGAQRCCRAYVTRGAARDGYDRNWNQAIRTATAGVAEIVAKTPLPYPLRQHHALALARFWSAVADVHARTEAP